VTGSSASPTDTLTVRGLDAPVEVLVDEWGVPHIYAESAGDLWLAQGFNAARDRLFQIDLWRRRGLGLLSEVLGPEYAAHDRAARLFLYRGDMAEEWAAYGPGTERISTAFTAGVNAFVELARRQESHRPPEFDLLGYLPSYWDPADIARIRSHGLVANLEDEVARALTLRDFGDPGTLGQDVEDLRKTREPAPHTLRTPDGLDLSVIPDDVLDVYRLATIPPWVASTPASRLDGSNNWVISGERTATGRPLLANDPHRAVTLPGLRYIAHLCAPGIDAVGAGEPLLPGLSIGHNGHLAFGFTIFPIDQEDLYVYRTHPDDPHRYRYEGPDGGGPDGGGWEEMTRVEEAIPVAGGDPVTTDLWFTRHGPVIRELPERNAAFAVRAAWLEPGMAPYLGSTSYLGARTPDEFTASLERWGAPGENQVYASPDGTIGWRPAGRVPNRPNWDGTLPVPGDGSHEWDGHHPVSSLPQVRDPEQGWFGTANQCNLPADYPNAERTVTYDWYPPYRHRRIAEELAGRTGWTVEDCVRLQTDYTSLPAREILAHLAEQKLTDNQDAALDEALALLAGWDAVLSADSAAAALFEVWYRRHLRPALRRAALAGRGLSEERIGAALRRLLPSDSPAADTADARTDLRLLPLAGPELLAGTLRAAVADLEGLLGSDRERWRWGNLHHARLTHPLAARLGADAADWVLLGPLPRGGSGDTVGAAAYAGTDFRQTGGATFRMVVDVGDWDNSVAMNSPGQAGDPRSPHYQDLFESWGSDGSFPLLYSRAKVEQHTARRLLLTPA
jgi:penicillin amidase